ncbi:hypothetical protein KEF85_09740 [Methylomonas paludis]|uniref:Uncharacterized protein n=1 Tax=Methylomonas paludis TaxID=1173101 RepID=A0A975MKN5_9GAMM|nr:hypothetical protein [Methylomonas paludis]QWF69658.1 hypothetical protein KEF85_09740 [Methylomonas paludis]
MSLNIQPQVIPALPGFNIVILDKAGPEENYAVVGYYLEPIIGYLVEIYKNKERGYLQTSHTPITIDNTDGYVAIKTDTGQVFSATGENYASLEAWLKDEYGFSALTDDSGGVL